MSNASFNDHPTPPVSVIIPVYNGMPFIGRTIDSVRRQTFADWELLICDNASKDGTADFVREELRKFPDHRIRLITDTELLPMADNWNRAIGYAHGEYIKVLPSDDLLVPHCLEMQASVLRDYPSVGFVTSGKEIIDAADKPLVRRVPLREGEYDWNRLGLRAIRAVVNVLGEPGGVLFRRELIDSCGGYRTGLRYFVDLELLLRFLKKSNAYVCGEPLYQFRVHGSGASATSSRPALEEYDQLLHEYADELNFVDYPWLRPYLKIKSRAVVALRSLAIRFANRS